MIKPWHLLAGGLLVCLLAFTGGPVKAEEPEPVRICLAGQDMVLVPAPVIAGDKVEVPVRAFMEALGAQVDWDPEKSKCWIIMPGQSLSLVEGQSQVRLNGLGIQLTDPLTTVDNRFMLPLDLLADSFDVEFSYDSNENVYYISLPKDQDFPLYIGKMQEKVQSTLELLDDQLAGAVPALQVSGLSGDDARAILANTANNAPYAVDVCTIDNKGIMISVEPPPYHGYEGSDLSTQEHIARLLQTHQPVMSHAFIAVEGFVAVDIERPLVNGNGDLMGSASLLIDPDPMFTNILGQQSKPVELMVMQPDGYIVFDTDRKQIGLNAMEDEYYKDYPELQALIKKIAVQDYGSGDYQFWNQSGTEVIKKHSYWTTVGLHGTQWRLIMNTRQY